VNAIFYVSIFLFVVWSVWETRQRRTLKELHQENEKSLRDLHARDLSTLRAMYNGAQEHLFRAREKLASGQFAELSLRLNRAAKVSFLPFSIKEVAALHEGGWKNARKVAHDIQYLSGECDFIEKTCREVLALRFPTPS
jgi:hypothetical protein